MFFVSLCVIYSSISCCTTTTTTIIDSKVYIFCQLANCNNHWRLHRAHNKEPIKLMNRGLDIKQLLRNLMISRERSRWLTKASLPECLERLNVLIERRPTTTITAAAATSGSDCVALFSQNFFGKSNRRLVSSRRKKHDFSFVSPTRDCLYEITAKKELA